jgi:hypothetical protein
MGRVPFVCDVDRQALAPRPRRWKEKWSRFPEQNGGLAVLAPFHPDWSLLIFGLVPFEFGTFGISRRFAI